jgi:hypothetical protein
MTSAMTSALQLFFLNDEAPHSFEANLLECHTCNSRYMRVVIPHVKRNMNGNSLFFDCLPPLATAGFPNFSVQREMAIIRMGILKGLVD